MRRCLVVLLLMFIITGCGNIDLSMGPIDPQLGDSSAAASIEDGDPFDYVEYEGTSIPVLTEPLPVNELFYLRSWMNEEYPDYKMVPKHLLAKSGCLLSRYGDIGDPERHGTLIDYVDISETDSGFEGRHEGYVLKDGALYLFKTDFYYEDIMTHESYSYLYTSREKDAGIGVEWNYSPNDPDDSNTGDYWASYIYDLNTKKLLESNIFIRKNMSLFSREPETPEFRNDEKKDVRQIKADLNSMIETGEIQELTYNTEPLIYEGTRFWYVVAYFVADGAREEPTMIYLDPMAAYLSQFRYEKTEGTSGDWVLTNDANRFVFDENWRLLSWSDDHYSADYTYSDNGIDLNITNKESGLAESVRFDY